MSGTLFVVATPIGNLEDISSRALKVLRGVSVIAAEDTRRTSHLLARYGITTRTTSLHQHNETAKAGALVRRLQAGESVALVSDAGTPTISDPGEVLLAAAIEAGIRVEPIPGPSAFLALLSVAGLPAESFTFLGFPPIKGNARKDWFAELASQRRTVVFYESPHRILTTLGEIHRNLGECNIVVGRELTKAHEEIVRGTVLEAIESVGTPRGEYCVALDLSRSTHGVQPTQPSDELIASEFGLIAKSERSSKRQIIGRVANKLGLHPNSVYQALERRKHLVE